MGTPVCFGVDYFIKRKVKAGYYYSWFGGEINGGIGTKVNENKGVLINESFSGGMHNLNCSYYLFPYRGRKAGLSFSLGGGVLFNRANIHQSFDAWDTIGVFVKTGGKETRYKSTGIGFNLLARADIFLGKNISLFFDLMKSFDSGFLVRENQFEMNSTTYYLPAHRLHLNGTRALIGIHIHLYKEKKKEKQQGL